MLVHKTVFPITRETESEQRKIQDNMDMERQKKYCKQCCKIYE